MKFHRNALFNSALIVPATAMLISSASGQEFNVDIGSNDAFPTPPSEYGAAADSAGYWNSAHGYGTSTPLYDLDGNFSGVLLSRANEFGDFTFDSPETTGSDEGLLDDLMDVGSAGHTSTLKITGLADGTYDLFTYAWAPDSPASRTSISVAPSGDPDQEVGGAWTGALTGGVTHAVHRLTIENGAFVTITATAVQGFGSVNGLQIVEFIPTTEPGANYCTSTVNSTGLAATMSATGSASIAANDLVLCAENVPIQPGVGIFIYSQAPFQNAVFDGYLCVSPSALQRIIQVTAPDAAGKVTQAIDYTGASTGTVPLAVSAGTTGHYQYWFRDPNGGGAGVNFTDGYMIDHID